MFYIDYYYVNNVKTDRTGGSTEACENRINKLYLLFRSLSTLEHNDARLPNFIVQDNGAIVIDFGFARESSSYTLPENFLDYSFSNETESEEETSENEN